MALTRLSGSPLPWLRLAAIRWLPRAPLEAPPGTAPVLIEAPVPQADPQVGVLEAETETWNILEES